MSRLEVRSADALLVRALQVWFDEQPRLPDGGALVITDLDSMPALGLDGEITCSYGDGAMLRRPFSFAQLEELMSVRGGKGARLVFFGEDAWLDGEKLPLTKAEGAILRVLYEAREPLSAAEIAKRAGEEAPQSNRIAVHISFLRAKTEKNGRPRLIFTRRAKGYELKND